jgi:hypothetical protein
MGDAAHAESLNHEVYRTPFAVEPPSELWNTPDNYKSNYTGPDKLPDKMKVWLVQKTGKNVGGVVARGDGLTDSPDAEILTLGFNVGKSYGDVGIGRQGNFLQWGYAAPPSQMTEPGRRLFLNCIYYIHRFDGKAPLIRRQASPRTDAVRISAFINKINGDQKKFFLEQFPEAFYERYGNDPDGLARYYRENLEWVYRDRVFKVDEELKGLGIDSNHKIESLQRLVELLDDSQRAATARKLLSRYTERSFETSQQGRQWLDENKGRIYFTDVGGYKFKVVPEDYSIRQSSRTSSR